VKANNKEKADHLLKKKKKKKERKRKKRAQDRYSRAI
jgi:hypothetical protein